MQSVDITPDLKNCHVFISVIGTPAQEKEAHRQAERQEGILAARARQAGRFEIHAASAFPLDESIERGTRVMQIIDKIEIPPDDEAATGEDGEESDGQE